MFDRLVFSKIKTRLGGRVKLIVTGGAPLARHVEDFLKVTMCCPVVQGYGLTETCAASFIGVPDSQVRLLTFETSCRIRNLITVQLTGGFDASSMHQSCIKHAPCQSGRDVRLAESHMRRQRHCEKLQGCGAGHLPTSPETVTGKWIIISVLSAGASGHGGAANAVPGPAAGKRGGDELRRHCQPAPRRGVNSLLPVL